MTTLVFDPAKDRINREKHGISLARGSDIEIVAVVADERRDYGEVRYRAFGYIDGAAYCLAFAVPGPDIVRAISLRRAHSKEMKRMSRKPAEPVFDDDNPEWTEADFARARPAAEVLAPEVLAAFPRTPVTVTLALDPDVLEHFKAKGPDWKRRINDALLGIVEKAP